MPCNKMAGCTWIYPRFWGINRSNFLGMIKLAKINAIRRKEKEYGKEKCIRRQRYCAYKGTEHSEHRSAERENHQAHIERIKVWKRS